MGPPARRRHERRCAVSGKPAGFLATVAAKVGGASQGAADDLCAGIYQAIADKRPRLDIVHEYELVIEWHKTHPSAFYRDESIWSDYQIDRDALVLDEALDVIKRLAAVPCPERIDEFVADVQRVAADTKGGAS